MAAGEVDGQVDGARTDSGESRPLNRWFVNDPAVAADIVLSARTAHRNSGRPQFVHHHPAEAPCSDACGFVTRP